MIKNRKLTIEILNLTDRQKDSCIVEFPLEAKDNFCGFDRVKDGFIECYVGHDTLTGDEDNFTNFYKLKAGTFDELTLVSVIPPTSEILVVNPNDSSQSCYIPQGYSVFEYRNKLYKANLYQPTVPFYQEIIFE